MTKLTYAGIGSRATPPGVLRDMTTMAAWLIRTPPGIDARRSYASCMPEVLL